ncbi:MAG: tautomerase family protein [Nitrososphaeraceae archaeon]
MSREPSQVLESFDNIVIIILFTTIDNIIYMPIVHISMYSGRTQREKDRVAEAITEDVSKILNVEKKEVIIVFDEATHGNWYVSGVRL